MTKWTIALAQIACIDGDVETNVSKMEEYIKKAYEAHADIVLFPETIVHGFSPKSEMIHLAEKRNGPTMQRLQKYLKKFPIHIIFGFAEKADEEILYNTTCFLQKDGTPLEFYRKVHLYNNERLIFNRGNEFTSFQINQTKAGLITCFDCEFPEHARILAQRGAQAFFINSANMAPFGIFYLL